MPTFSRAARGNVYTLEMYLAAQFRNSVYVRDAFARRDVSHKLCLRTLAKDLKSLQLSAYLHTCRPEYQTTFVRSNAASLPTRPGSLHISHIFFVSLFFSFFLSFTPSAIWRNFIRAREVSSLREICKNS